MALYQMEVVQWLAHLALGAWYLVQAYVLVFCVYVFVPVGVYLLRAKAVNRLFQRQALAGPAQTDFVLLIPAHNEEALLPGLLASIRQLEYPAARFRTVVVADNCTDATAQLARQAGAECLERRTSRPSDKAQALRYAAEVLGLEQAAPASVVCVVDADCRLDPSFLAELDYQFAQPGAAPVVQCDRRVGNAFDSDVTVLDAAAEAMRQRVGAGTRRLLGLESFIFGLGCCMRAPIFAQLVALPTSSLAEDKEWKAHLARRGVRVAYCPTASLSYHTVDDGPAFVKQRQRWLAGHLATVRAHGPAMLGQGLVRGRVSQLDFACDLLQPPRSCLLVAVLLFGGVGLGLEQWSLVSGWLWLGIAVGLVCYGMLGLRLVGAAPRHFLALISGARLVAGVARTVAQILLGQKDKEWRPTR